MSSNDLSVAVLSRRRSQGPNKTTIVDRKEVLKIFIAW